YVCLDDCSGALLELTATGLTSGLTAKRRFTDLAFGLFENPARTIKRDAFAWGSPVYARITQARNDTCYRVQWVDPGGAVATHDLTGSGISGTVTDAKLRLLMASSPNNSRTHNALRVTASWAENTITWNNQPGVAGGPADAQSTGTVNNTLLRWTLTADVNGF